MKTYYFLILGLFFSIPLFAQTGIGTTTPNASAKLDVYSTNKGFLPPRVTLTSATDASTIASPAEGLLVYNLGSVGLQAGYYYWNGTSWATIATASSAGNGVTSSDMVKLYSKAYSAATADSTIANASGYKFTVPVSGRYLFDFSSSGYVNQTSMTITFKVRQGSTDLATDAQTGNNNNVHVEYNGKLEVNLQAGVTYNVYVLSSGSRDGGDYDRVYYKMVSGNLPVTGQSVDYIQASLSTNQSLSAAANIIFNVSSGAGITITSGGFNLLANKTYKLEAALGGTSGGYAYYGWVDNTNTLLPGGSIGTVMKAGSPFTDAPQDKAVVYFTPTANTTVYLRVYSLSGTLTAYAPSMSSNYSSSWANITQIGSSAFVNPWTLSGANTYNTTGNVGIGNSSPTTTLDVTGSLQVSGNTTLKSNLNIGTGVGSEGGEIQLVNAVTASSLSGTAVSVDIYQDRLRIFEGGGNFRGVFLDLAKAPSGVGGELMYKASGFVNRGVDVTLGNLKARIAATGNFSLQLSTVSGSYSVYGSHYLVDNGAYSNGIDGSSPRSITTTPTYINSGNNFLGAGNTSVWLLMDTTAQMSWRITMIVGAGYNNNFISIERL
jgi:hypothetical protein